MFRATEPRSLTYDAASRSTRFVPQTDGWADFSYDATGQLTAADYDCQADLWFAYDLNGNRTIESYVTGAECRSHVTKQPHRPCRSPAM